MAPKVSIIVPVYNVEHYLKRCLESLLNQSLREIEILLVDDGSTDTSGLLCDKAAERDSRIKVIHKENEGAGMARNAALDAASGEYVGFVDSDDYVDLHMFEALYSTAKKYGSDMVLSGFVFVDGNMFSEKGESLPKYYFHRDTHFQTKEEIAELRRGIVGALPEDPDDSKYGMGLWKNLYRTEIIKENRLYFQSERKILSEDALFLLDFIPCIQRATGIKEAFYNYCRNGDSISKGYKEDRLEKGLVFFSEVEKRLREDAEQKVYQPYLFRFWQAFCRTVCSQEILHAAESGTERRPLKERLKRVCTHPLTVEVLHSYPIGSLPFKQKIFAYAMKYKCYAFLTFLVHLRSR